MLKVSSGAKLIVRSDPPDDQYLKDSIHIQVQNADNSWSEVVTIIPRRYWSTDIIDMSEYLPDARGDVKVRLCFTDNHRVDFVGLDTSSQATMSIQIGQLVNAIHSVDGDVSAKLLYSENLYAELVPSQNIELSFTLPEMTMEKRDYVIILEGHYLKIG